MLMSVCGFLFSCICLHSGGPVGLFSVWTLQHVYGTRPHTFICALVVASIAIFCIQRLYCRCRAIRQTSETDSLITPSETSMYRDDRRSINDPKFWLSRAASRGQSHVI
ncbi:hypothetical protein K431DRAFT_349093 [Polychaeton citri CBS 116435]|uniref:Secreted peptide n=1 Tax=Polychaeton citri CBS 116435 TaxID=1314669 RepID=A0A9P4Q456_9PEZI|nr:hypothetical protein K431DRAFT_349093 [Polychaeton citri CBS 116435]